MSAKEKEKGEQKISNKFDEGETRWMKAEQMTPARKQSKSRRRK